MAAAESMRKACASLQAWKALAPDKGGIGQQPLSEMEEHGLSAKVTMETTQLFLL